VRLGLARQGGGCGMRVKDAGPPLGGDAAEGNECEVLPPGPMERVEKDLSALVVSFGPVRRTCPTGMNVV